MKNFFKTIVGWIMSGLTLKEQDEKTSSLTFICPGCGFQLQLSDASFVEASKKSRPQGTSGHIRHARSLPLTTDQIAVLKGPRNVVPRPQHAVLPSTAEQIITFAEPLNTAPYFPHPNPQPDVQSSHIETNQRSQFKFPPRFLASSSRPM